MVALEVKGSWLGDHRPHRVEARRNRRAVFDESLFTLVPVLYRELERALGSRSDERPYLQWGSWVGGDRDGNPEVTHDVTEAALQVQTEHALGGLETAARRVGRWLTLSEESTPPTEDLRRLLDAGEVALGEAAGDARAHRRREPYRAALLVVAERLWAARLHLAGAYPSPDACVADLRTVQDALRAALPA
jgi:phosphoenolpyruvate carboxylase